jgi:Lon protease-like protein
MCATAESQTIPLFPLSMVLFPGGPLKLRIFEARYVDMVGRCMRESQPFGVALLTEGNEAGGPALTAGVGTSARIVDFERLEDGLLGITALGERSFRIMARHRQADGLNLATVDWLPLEGTAAVPAESLHLAKLLRYALPQLQPLYDLASAQYDDAGWVSARLVEILPLPLVEKQRCLEMTEPLLRLQHLNSLVTVEMTGVQ